jgi:hypothetical protein
MNCKNCNSRKISFFYKENTPITQEKLNIDKKFFDNKVLEIDLLTGILLYSLSKSENKYGFLYRFVE